MAMDADRSILGDVMMFKMRIPTSLPVQDPPSFLAHDVALSPPDDRLKADDTRRTEGELGATFLAPTAHLLSGLSRRFQD